MQSLDGLERLTTVRFLYLDHNSLPESELLRLPGTWVNAKVQAVASAGSHVRGCRRQACKPPCPKPTLHQPTCRPVLLPAPSDVLPAGVELETLDLRGNPGLTPAVEAALEASPLLTRAEFVNGRRLRR